jgi:hypothetical protein
MKIRYYQKIDGWRWLGFILAMIGAFILSNANVETQWMGWAIATVSCSIWIYMGIKDRDTPRALRDVSHLYWHRWCGIPQDPDIKVNKINHSSETNSS